MRNTGAEDPSSIDEDHIHVVAAIVWHSQYDNRFLIAQRQQGKHLEYYWELPGGKLEAGESPWQALRRELAEEINVEVVSGNPYMRVYHRYPERNILLDTWSVDEYQGEVRAREQQPLAWIDIEDIEQYRFPPADVPILEAIKRNATA
ncbi:MAG: (deoxy)nucleoside triphosphate pyrophosphohydrolase [Gammaproteobacteria bacterium]|nr:(deoxy)nucleoside triphosphate pyrophosphohydrolase [Gammaproteobacteria bacterium]